MRKAKRENKTKGGERAHGLLITIFLNLILSNASTSLAGGCCVGTLM
jgi:hypothetical protein